MDQCHSLVPSSSGGYGSLTCVSTTQEAHPPPHQSLWRITRGTDQLQQNCNFPPLSHFPILILIQDLININNLKIPLLGRRFPSSESPTSRSMLFVRLSFRSHVTLRRGKITSFLFLSSLFSYFFFFSVSQKRPTRAMHLKWPRPWKLASTISLPPCLEMACFTK